MSKDLFGWYYAQSPDGVVQIVQFLDGKCYYLGHEDIMAEPICLVPTYDEYKAMQEQLNKEGTWYTEISYKKLEKENARLKERDEVFSVLIENLHGLQQEKWYDLVEHGTREQRLDFLRNTEKHTLFGAIDKNMQLMNLLKECQEIIEWYKADCGYKDLPTESVLTKIDEALK